MNITAISLMEGPSETRDLFIERVEVLDKVKELVFLPDGEHMTLRQVADYYEVDIELVRKVVQRHKDELLSDGMKMLKGAKLSRYKSSLQVEVPELKKVPAIQLLPRRAILRLGMVLRNSVVAEKVRTYLLDMEEKVGDEEKRLVFEGKWTSELEEKVLKMVVENEEKGIRFNDTLQQISEEIGVSVYQIKNYWYTGGQGNPPLRDKLDEKMKRRIASRSNRSKLNLLEDNVIDLFSISQEDNEKEVEQPNSSSAEVINEEPSIRNTEIAELKQMVIKQMDLNNRLFSEMEHLRRTNHQLISNMEYLRNAVLDSVNRQNQLHEDFQVIKQEILELKKIVDIRNQEEYQRIERRSAKLSAKLKEARDEVNDLQKDMEAMIRRAGLSMLTGIRLDEPEGLSFKMDKNGNLDKLR
jgi:hypothetical protein